MTTSKWDAYEAFGEKAVSDNTKSKLQKLISENLGEYAFMGNTFSLPFYDKLIKMEIDEIEVKINGVKLFESNQVCFKCKSKKVQSMPIQVAAADEPLAMKHTCLQCQHVRIER